jgi:hypothetical protein
MFTVGIMISGVAGDTLTNISNEIIQLAILIFVIASMRAMYYFYSVSFGRPFVAIFFSGLVSLPFRQMWLLLITLPGPA